MLTRQTRKVLSRENMPQRAKSSAKQHERETTKSARGKGRGGNKRQGRRAGPYEAQSSGEVGQSTVEVRGRGKTSRGRGQSSRGRGRGRGTGRTKKRAGISADDVSRVALLRQQRTQEMDERVDGMGLEELRHLVKQILMREPGMVCDVIALQSSRNPGQSPPSPSINTQVTWCTCGRCSEMPTDMERKCCGLIEPDCLSIIPEFDLLVLEPMYLRQFNRYRGQVFGLPGNGDNPAMRHAAYTQFILFLHGKLGHGNRRVIPSCCVMRIRRSYPEQSGIYRGFIPTRLA